MINFGRISLKFYIGGLNFQFVIKKLAAASNSLLMVFCRAILSGGSRGLICDRPCAGRGD
jgi:hypothetical protein